MSHTNDLIEAAINLGKAISDFDSASLCGMPETMMDALYANRLDAEANLEHAAINLYHDMLDGEAA